MSPFPPQPSSSSPSTLKATYTSRPASQTFTHPLPPATVQSTKEKSVYLSALRKSITQLQEDVNGFLTLKMEEDKALAADAGIKMEEKVEEENYGEEIVEDEG